MDGLSIDDGLSVMEEISDKEIEKKRVSGLLIPERVMEMLIS